MQPTYRTALRETIDALANEGRDHPRRDAVEAATLVIAHLESALALKADAVSILANEVRALFSDARQKIVAINLGVFNVGVPEGLDDSLKALMTGFSKLESQLKDEVAENDIRNIAYEFYNWADRADADVEP